MQDDKPLNWQQERDLHDEIEWLRKIMFAARRVCNDIDAKAVSGKVRDWAEIKKDIDIVRGRF